MFIFKDFLGERSKNKIQLTFSYNLRHMGVSDSQKSERVLQLDIRVNASLSSILCACFNLIIVKVKTIFFPFQKDG